MVSAKFVADFSNFTQQIDRAEVKLRDFSKASLSVDKDLSRLGTSFSGQRILQEATLAAKAVESIGGASKLTAAEQSRLNATLSEALQKYDALGIEAPKTMRDLEAATRKVDAATRSIEQPVSTLNTRMVALGTAVGTFVGNLGAQLIQQGVAALVNMGKAAFDSAGQIVDLKNKTGLSTDAIQRMQFVADQTGGSLEQFTQASFMLGQRLAGGSGSIQDAVAKVGLSFQDLRQMKPETQFETIVAKLGAMSNEQERNLLGIQLFGKSFSSIAASVGDGYDAIASKASLSSQAQLESLDRAADRWSEFTTNSMATIRSWLGTVVQAFDGATDAADEFMSKSGRVMKDQQKAMSDAGTFSPGVGVAGIGAATSGPLAGVTVAGLQATTAAYGSYVSQLSDAREQVSGLKQEEIEQILAAKQLGISVDELTAKFGLSETALAMVTEQSKQAVKTTKDHAKAAKELADAHSFVAHEVGILRGLMSDGPLFQEKPPTGAIQALERQAFLTKEIAAQNKLAGDSPLFQEAAPAAAKGWAAGFGASLKTQLGPAILQAVQGGGNVLNSVAGTFGADITKKLFGGKAIQESITNTLGKTVGGALGSILPGIGALAGPAIEGLGKLFGKMFGGEGKKVNDMRDQFISAAGGLDALNKQAAAAGTTLDRLLSVKKVKDFEAAVSQLTGALDEQTMLEDRLAEAMARHGVAAEQLGLVARNKAFSKGAEELLLDYAALTQAGFIPADDAITAMQASINEFTHAAIASASQIPEQLKPMLQRMVEMGLLTDVSGEKLMDLGSLNFADTLISKFDLLIDKLNQFLDRLSQVPSAIDVDMRAGPSRVADVDMPSYMTPDMMPGFARGTGGSYLNFGSGTNVTLHGRERVMTEGEGKAEGGAWARLSSDMRGIRADLARYMDTSGQAMQDRYQLARGRTA